MRLTSNRLKFAYLVLWVLPLMVGGLVPSTAKGMYDPKHGRWLQRDPLGVRPTRNGGVQLKAQYADGMSLCEYVRSSPTMHSDPRGLQFMPGCQFYGHPCNPPPGPYGPLRPGDFSIGNNRLLEMLYYLEFAGGETRARDEWANDIKKMPEFAGLECSISTWILLQAGQYLRSSSGTSSQTVRYYYEVAASAANALAVAPLGCFTIRSTTSCQFQKGSAPWCGCSCMVAWACKTHYSVSDVFDFHSYIDEWWLGLLPFWGNVGGKSNQDDLAMRPFLITVDWDGSFAGGICAKK